MRKILSLVLGLLWALPVWGACYDYTSATGTVVQDGTPTPDNPIYPTFYQQGNMVLRKVGNIADSYDATTGKITRRVGEYIFTGRESIDRQYNVYGVTTIPYDMNKVTNASLCSHNKTYVNTVVTNDRTFDKFLFFTNVNWVGFGVSDTPPEITDTETFKQWLAAQYAAGTPVKIYYPLDTEVVEDWTGTQWCDKIKIATTKYNETKFSPLNTALANAISVVDTVVSNTITQAGRIATLQAQKQTRPNDIADDSEKCPAGKKCLLVEDAAGIPHWYEIVTGRLPDGYTELEYIESTGTQWIDTGYAWTSQNRKVDMDVMITTYTGNSHFFASTRGSKYDLNPYFSGTNSYFATYIGNTSYIQATSAKDVKNNIVWNLTSDKNFNLQVNGTSVGTATVTEIPTSEISVWLLHVHSSGDNHWSPLRAKLYQTKMWDNDELVRDFVPAKNPDGKIGMYDLANGVFYENAGEGSFVAGDPVSE